MSVTIIGCGWLGLPLGEELVNRGYPVKGSVRNTEGFEKLREAGIKPFQLDLMNSVQIEKNLIETTEVLIISIPPLHRDEPKKYQEILIALLDQFPNNIRVIFTSSTGIYPKVAGDFVETFELNPKQDSTVLNLSEETIRQSEKQHVIFRLGGLVGPNRHPIRYLQGRKNVKNPNGPINFVHQGDCIQAITEAIENKDINGTFNLVNPYHPLRKNHYLEAAKHYGLEAPSFSDDDSTERLISSEKIIRDFAFEFEFPIDQYPQLNFD